MYFDDGTEFLMHSDVRGVIRHDSRSITYNIPSVRVNYIMGETLVWIPDCFYQISFANFAEVFFTSGNYVFSFHYRRSAVPTELGVLTDRLHDFAIRAGLFRRDRHG